MGGVCGFADGVNAGRAARASPSSSPDCLDPGRLETAVARDERGLQMQSGGAYDSVGHIWHGKPRYLVDCFRNGGIDRGNNQPRGWISQRSVESLERLKWDAPTLHEIDGFHH